MPAEQQGSVFTMRDGKRKGIRWVEDGERQQKSGFRSATEARKWWRDEIASRLNAGVSTREQTLEEFFEEYLATHGGADRTKAKLREDMASAIAVFGEKTLRELEGGKGQITAWLAAQAETSRARKLRAVKQVLKAAADWDRMLRNPAQALSAAEVRAEEIEPFSDTAEVDAFAEELPVPWAQLVVFGTETGLRPEEWAALERRDTDTRAGVVSVARTYTVAGGLKHYAKTSRSRRVVPLTDRALQALDELPARIDTPLLWSNAKYGHTRGPRVHLSLPNFRNRIWRPGLQAAGLQRNGAIWLPSPYAMRHTFAAWALEASFDAFELSRLMGTSVAMIDKTYGHLVRDHAERARDRLNQRPSIVVEKTEEGRG
jgi:integrase